MVRIRVGRNCLAFFFDKNEKGFLKMERDFKGIWIPKEILALGLIEIIRWVREEYEINLNAKNPTEEE